MEKELKIKPLTKQQIVISLDRLTRFKYTEDKYLRVFKEIIASNLISPKYKKKELDLLDYGELTEIADCILNFSLRLLHSHGCHPELVSGSVQCTTLERCRNKFGMTERGNLKSYIINQKLLEYEKSVFKFDKNVEKLLNNKIDYNMALGLFEGDLPCNLKWLKSLAQDRKHTVLQSASAPSPLAGEGDFQNEQKSASSRKSGEGYISVYQIQNREKFGLKFPIEKIILVEGITEEILLPKFAKLCGCDFDKKGIHLISAGGKNQVVKLFYQFADILKLPIFILLDSDAKENFEEIKPKLRENDKVYILKNGEIEDVLPLNLIKRTLNQMLKNLFSVSIDDLRKLIRNGEPMTKVLHEILKEKGLEFKKAEFAALVAENISDIKDVSPEIQEIVEQLRHCETKGTAEARSE